MEKATEPARAERKAGRRGRPCARIDRLVIDEERVLKAAVPPGSRLYADLKAYCRDPTPRRKRELQAAALTGCSPPMHRLCHPRPVARQAPRQQDRVAPRRSSNGRISRFTPTARRTDIRCQVTRRTRSARGFTPARRPLGDRQRYAPYRRPPRLPRRLPRLDEDLRQARRLVLGLPRQPARHPRRATHPPLARPHPPARRRLTARPFAPVTVICFLQAYLQDSAARKRRRRTTNGGEPRRPVSDRFHTLSGRASGNRNAVGGSSERSVAARSPQSSRGSGRDR